MIKKSCFILTSIMIMSFNIFAAQFNNNYQYITLKNKDISAPKVLEFFSFYCSHCYEFENIWHISSRIKESLPTNFKIKKYHVNFLGGDMGETLTRAWSIAIAMGIEDKVIKEIFDGIHKTKHITDSISLRQYFIKVAQIKPNEYDAAWNSFIVKALISQQAKAAVNLNVQGVPAIFINGKYMVKNDGLDSSSIESYIQQYISVVKFLTNKKQ